MYFFKLRKVMFRILFGYYYFNQVFMICFPGSWKETPLSYTNGWNKVLTAIFVFHECASWWITICCRQNKMLFYFYNFMLE